MLPLNCHAILTAWICRVDTFVSRHRWADGLSSIIPHKNLQLVRFSCSLVISPAFVGCILVLDHDWILPICLGCYRIFESRNCQPTGLSTVPSHDSWPMSRFWLPLSQKISQKRSQKKWRPEKMLSPIIYSLVFPYVYIYTYLYIYIHIYIIYIHTYIYIYIYIYIYAHDIPMTYNPTSKSGEIHSSTDMVFLMAVSAKTHFLSQAVMTGCWITQTTKNQRPKPRKHDKSWKVADK